MCVHFADYGQARLIRLVPGSGPHVIIDDGGDTAAAALDEFDLVAILDHVERVRGLQRFQRRPDSSIVGYPISPHIVGDRRHVDIAGAQVSGCQAFRRDDISQRHQRRGTSGGPRKKENAPPIMRPPEHLIFGGNCHPGAIRPHEWRCASAEGVQRGPNHARDDWIKNYATTVRACFPYEVTAFLNREHFSISLDERIRSGIVHKQGNILAALRQ